MVLHNWLDCGLVYFWQATSGPPKGHFFVISGLSIITLDGQELGQTIFAVLDYLVCGIFNKGHQGSDTLKYGL